MFIGQQSEPTKQKRQETFLRKKSEVFFFFFLRKNRIFSINNIWVIQYRFIIKGKNLKYKLNYSILNNTI